MASPNGGSDSAWINTSTEAQVIGLEAVPESSREARRFVTDLTRQWRLDHVQDTAALCAAELATNAVLHARGRFFLTVRPAGPGLRIDVLDSSPSHLPLPTPTEGSALDLTTFGTSGRGLQIVAALADRWGIFTTEDAKTVWVEVSGEAPAAPTKPITVLHTRRQALDLIHFNFLNMPVRAAVASGIQVEEVIREIQFDRGSSGVTPNIARLFTLLDGSASVRLSGRHQALIAAGEGRLHFDLTVAADPASLQSLTELSVLLRELSDLLPIPVPAPSEDVITFRIWLNEEMAHQQSGSVPSPCPLPG
jgi:hypothetical protein